MFYNFSPLPPPVNPPLCLLTQSTFCFIWLPLCPSSMYADLLVKDFVCPATECLRGHPMPLYPIRLQIKVKDMLLHRAHSECLNYPFIFARTVNCLRLASEPWQNAQTSLLKKFQRSGQNVMLSLKVIHSGLLYKYIKHSGKLELYRPLLVQSDLNELLLRQLS